MRWQCQSAVVPSGGQTGDPTARKAWPPWWPAGLAWALWALTLAGLGGNFWFDQLPRQAGSFEVDRLNAAAYPVLLAAVSAATVEAVVASRRHRHPVGWPLLATGLTMVVDLGINGYVRYGVVVRPGSPPGARYLAGVSFGIFLVWISLAGFVLLLTPPGRCPRPGGGGGPGSRPPGRCWSC